MSHRYDRVVASKHGRAVCDPAVVRSDHRAGDRFCPVVVRPKRGAARGGARRARGRRAVPGRDRPQKCCSNSGMIICRYQCVLEWEKILFQGRSLLKRRIRPRSYEQYPIR